MKPTTIAELQRAAFRVELVGLLLLLAPALLSLKLAATWPAVQKLLPVLEAGSVATQGRGTYPMLERYCPRDDAAVPAGPWPTTAPDWVALVEPELFGTRLETDWTEVPALPSGPDPPGLSPPPSALVDRKRNGRLLLALRGALLDCARDHDAGRGTRVFMALLSCMRQGVVYEARAMGGFVPANRGLLGTGAYWMSLPSRVICEGAVPLPLAKELLQRLVALDALLPLRRMRPDAWPSLARRLMVGHEDVVDPVVLGRLLAPSSQPPQPIRIAERRACRTAGPASLWDIMPFRFGGARRMARSFAWYDLMATRSEGLILAEVRALALVAASVLIRDETGRWPTSGDELLSRVPLRLRQDPFTGDRLRCGMTATGPLVWTPGVEGALDRTAPTAKCVVLAGRTHGAGEDR